MAVAACHRPRERTGRRTTRSGKKYRRPQCDARLVKCQAIEARVVFIDMTRKEADWGHAEPAA